jgi:hypothetical protein
MRPNISGKAVELIQNRLDMQVFIYMSNFAKYKKRCGEVWLSMMKDIVIEKGRKMKALDPNGQPSSVILNQPAFDQEKGEEYLKNDITRATLEVAVDVGPSSTSRKAATVRALTGMASISQDPETRTVLEALTMMNMEGEGISDARQFFRAKLVRMGVVKPSEEEAQEMAQEQANKQPDAQTQYLQAAAAQADADAANKRAETIETIANARLKQAQTDKTIAETDQNRLHQAIDGAEAITRAAMPPTGELGM